MTLPAAATMALWAGHYRQGAVSADELIDACGPLSLDVLAAFRGAQSVELVVLADGDSSGVATANFGEALAIGSALFIRGGDCLLLPPHWTSISAHRSGLPVTRAEAERLMQESMQSAFEHFGNSPIFGADRPEVPEVNFPPAHPARLRELFLRALTLSALTQSLRNSWSPSTVEHALTAQTLSHLATASRRGFEAATTL